MVDDLNFYRVTQLFGRNEPTLECKCWGEGDILSASFEVAAYPLLELALIES